MALAHIVVEGQRDQALLKQLIPTHIQENVKLWVAGSNSGVASLGSTLIAERQQPVAIVADADSSLLEHAQQRKKFLKEFVGYRAGRVRYEVFVFIPEIEVLFFESELLIERVTKSSLSQIRPFMEWYRENPRRALEQLMPDMKFTAIVETTIQSITDQDAELMRQHPEMQALITFLTEVTEPLQLPS